MAEAKLAPRQCQDTKEDPTAQESLPGSLAPLRDRRGAVRYTWRCKSILVAAQLCLLVRPQRAVIHQASQADQGSFRRLHVRSHEPHAEDVGDADPQAVDDCNLDGRIESAMQEG